MTSCGASCGTMILPLRQRSNRIGVRNRIRGQTGLGVRSCNHTFLFSASLKGRRTVTWSTARPKLPCCSDLLVPYAGCLTARKGGLPSSARESGGHA